MKKFRRYICRKGLISDIVKCALIAAFTVSVLFLSFNYFLGDTAVYYVINISLVFSALLIIFTEKRENPSVYKIALLSFVLSIICSFSYHFLTKYKIIEYFENIENVKNIIQGTGVWGILVFFLITLLQVIILPIPTAVTVVAGSVIYNSHVSFIVSSLATFLGSVLVFLLGRICGKRLMRWLFDEQKAKKYAKTLGKKGKAPFILMMLLPFFPDDLICFAAGLTDMTFKFFAISVAVARTLYIFFISYFGDGGIIPFSGWGIPVWIGIIALVCVAGIYFHLKFNKSK